MKRRYGWKVVTQAARMRVAAECAFAAVGNRPSASSLAQCRKLGVGLLYVHEDGINVLSPASFGIPGGLAGFKRNILELLHWRTPNGTGGLTAQARKVLEE